MPVPAVPVRQASQPRGTAVGEGRTSGGVSGYSLGDAVQIFSEKRQQWMNALVYNLAPSGDIEVQYADGHGFKCVPPNLISSFLRRRPAEAAPPNGYVQPAPQPAVQQMAPPANMQQALAGSPFASPAPIGAVMRRVALLAVPWSPSCTSLRFRSFSVIEYQ